MYVIYKKINNILVKTSYVSQDEYVIRKITKVLNRNPKYEYVYKKIIIAKKVKIKRTNY